MPNEYGLLNATEVALIEEWLTTHWIRRRCTCCEDAAELWVLGNHLLMDQAYPGDPSKVTIVRRMTTVAYVVAFCNHCAYTIRFNASMIPGLLGDTPTSTGEGVRTSGN